MRWSGRLAPAALVLLMFTNAAAACPCMDGFPAMGHGPTGERVPRQVPTTIGCGATPVEMPERDGMVDLPIMPASGLAGWEAFPAGPTGVAVSGLRVLAGPGRVSEPSALLSPVRADAGAWEASLSFKMGGPGQDPVGNASFSVRFAILDAEMLNLRTGPALTIEIDNQGADGYPVTSPSGAGFVINDSSPHNLTFRQDVRSLKVHLDGRFISEVDPVGLMDECVRIGFSGPSKARSQPVSISTFALRSEPDRYANQRLVYGYEPEDMPFNSAASSAAGAVAPCSVPEVRCRIVEGMALRESVVQCDDRTGLVVEPKPGNEPNLQAAQAAYRKFGCGVPDWRASAVLWQVKGGLHEHEDRSQWPGVAGANAMLYTDTDTVMYGPGGATTFGCDLIREHILIQMHYNSTMLAASGVPASEVGIFHWDGDSLHDLRAPGRHSTLLGDLTIVDAGHDKANRTVWAIVKIERDVDGRALNNNYATIKLSDGGILGNGYMLGTYTPSQDSPPAVAPLLFFALLAAAFAWRRTTTR